MVLGVVCMFQSHRVRKGDLNSTVSAEVSCAQVEFQSHRVRKGDFNLKNESA